MFGFRYCGLAPGAKIAFTDASSSPSGDELKIPEDMALVFGPHYAAGARIGSHSWGADAFPTTYDFVSDQVNCH